MAWMRLFQCSIFQILISLSPTALAASTPLKMSVPGCPDKCGNINIPYPFGTLPGCYRNDGFQITCSESANTPPKALLGANSSNIELINIDITRGEARVYKSIGFRCYNAKDQIESNNTRASMDLRDFPFLFSHKRNKFTVIGCDNLAYIVGQGEGIPTYQYPCASLCDLPNNIPADNSSCNGLGCCQIPIHEGLNYYEVEWGYNKNDAWSSNPCNYAVLVEEDWYKFQVQDLSNDYFLDRTQKRVPIVLDWAIRDTGICQDGVEKSPNPACLSNQSSCNTTGIGEEYLCQCLPGYQGNPYLPNGCIDIDECNSTEKYPCSGNAICSNTDGNFTCSCPKGLFKHGEPQVGKDATCITDTAQLTACLIISLGFGTSFSAFLLYFAIRKRIKLFERRKQKKMKEKFFNKNRGYILQKRIASDEDATQRLRIFSLDELEKATNKFDNALILGRGGHGEVYKGILSDQRIVAIKRSKIIDQAETNQFINEVVILSQINHRNVVKLYGCCLETEVPLLVYEFISNGTLFSHLHTEPCLLTWTHRLRIALQAARAIAYLHLSATISVFHRDIKSSNILLDDYFTSKVSDFGASRSVQLDQTGINTGIQGTFGYLDPEYYYTGRLTPKSDVYSFGVILAELLVREKPNSVLFEGGGLVAYFTSAIRENRLFEILDPRVVVHEGHRTELEAVANLADICVRMKGEERPTMKEVEVQLENLWQSHQHHEQFYKNQNVEKRQSLLPDSKTSNDTTRQYSFEQELLSSSIFPR